MAKRIDALVNVLMDAEEAAEEIGCSLDELVQWGNGYAVVEVAETPAPKPKKGAKKVKSLIPDPEALGLESDEG